MLKKVTQLNNLCANFLLYNLKQPSNKTLKKEFRMEALKTLDSSFATGCHNKSRNLKPQLYWRKRTFSGAM